MPLTLPLANKFGGGDDVCPIDGFADLASRLQVLRASFDQFKRAEWSPEVAEYLNFALLDLVPALRSHWVHDRTSFRRSIVVARAALMEDSSSAFCAKVRILINDGHLRSDVAHLLLAVAVCMALEGFLREFNDPSIDLGPSTLASEPARLRIVRDLMCMDPGQFESNICPFEQLLRSDPSDVYGRMTVESKRSYRRRVIDAAGADVTVQKEFACRALQMASNHMSQLTSSTSDRESHIGHWLFHPEPSHFIDSETMLSTNEDRAIPKGFWILSAFAVAIGALMEVSIVGTSMSALPIFALLLAVLYQSLLPTLEFLTLKLRSEAALPVIDFTISGLPEKIQVVVALPTLLVTKDQVKSVLNIAERNFITSNDTQVSIAILTDYCDSKHQMPLEAEAELLSFVATKIDELNARHGVKGTKPFALLHRERIYSASESIWMGRERKRGKLEALNKLILGLGNEFSLGINDAKLVGAKYVLVVDEDCIITLNSVQLLAGALEHPLSCPISNEHGAVIRGHGLLVPFTATLASAVDTWHFSYLFTGPQAIPRSKLKATRNFLFDAVGRCHFPGKGMYNAECFYHACKTIPDSAILSHDTLEAALVRPAYLGAAGILEGFPKSMHGLLARNHRWMRGNIQNAWFSLRPNELGRMPGAYIYVLACQLFSDGVSLLLSVAIIYAMMRSSISLLGVLLTAALFATASTAFKFLGSIAEAIFFRSPLTTPWPAIGASLVRWILFGIQRLSSCLLCSCLFLDAVFRTLNRLCKRRKLLEWSASVEVDAKKSSVSAISLVEVCSSIIAAALLVAEWKTDRLDATSGITLVAWLIYPLLGGFFDGSWTFNGRFTSE